MANDTLILVGSEDVRNAGAMIRSAAGEISSAAANLVEAAREINAAANNCREAAELMQLTNDQQRAFLEEWYARLVAVSTQRK